jgi:hypothetical protein
MSVQYKNYPIYIDGSSVWGEIKEAVFSKSKDTTGYETAVTSILETITNRANGIGQKLFNALPADKNIVIVPYNDQELIKKYGKCNALAAGATSFERGEARVRFTPESWKAGGQCALDNAPGIGIAEDEVLLHELLHAYRKVRGTFNRMPLNTPGMSYENLEEYFAIVVSNIYMSENGKLNFRKDHAGFEALPANSATSDKFIEDKENHKWVSYLWNIEQPFSLFVAGSPAKFNPFRAYKNWLDNKHRIMTTSW